MSDEKKKMPVVDFLKSIDMENTPKETIDVLKSMGDAINNAMNEYLVDTIDTKALDDKLADALKSIAGKEDLSQVKDEITDIKSAIIKIKAATEKGSDGTLKIKSLEDQIAEQFKGFTYQDNKTGVLKIKTDELKEKGIRKTIDLIIKEAPSSVTMTSGGQPVAGGITIDNQISVAPKLIPILRDVANTANISTTSVVYAEITGTNGDAAWVPEGGLKPAMNVTLGTKTINVGKIALTAKITSEVMSDIPQLVQEIRSEIINKIDTKEAEGILNGSGTGGEIKGVAADFPAFSLTGLEVEKPNMYDAIVAGYTQIVSTSNMAYAPNAIRMNPVDYAKMQLTKNTNGDYIRPFKVGDELITGLRVIQDASTEIGSFIMADFRYLNIRDYQVLSITFGWENDDFTRNMVTMIGEKRLLAYVKSQYKTAFLSDTFANVITGITPKG